MFPPGRPKRLFVFVNPFGGRRAGYKIYLDDVKPILDDAEIVVTLQGGITSQRSVIISL